MLEMQIEINHQIVVDKQLKGSKASQMHNFIFYALLLCDACAPLSKRHKERRGIG